MLPAGEVAAGAGGATSAVPRVTACWDPKTAASMAWHISLSNLGRLGCCFLVQGCFALSLFCSLSRARQVWLSNSHRLKWPQLVTMFLCPCFPRCPPVLSVAPRLRSPGAPSSAGLPRCCAVLRGDAAVLVPPSPGRPTGAFVCSLPGAPGVDGARSSRST